MIPAIVNRPAAVAPLDPSPSRPSAGAEGRADEHRPTWDDRVEIGPESAAEWAGFCAGVEGEPAAAPGHYSPAEAGAFARGFAAGVREYAEEMEAWLADREPTDAEIHHAELGRRGPASSSLVATSTDRGHVARRG